MTKAMFAMKIICAMAIVVPASAHAARIDGSGSAPTCPAKGKLKMKPALVTDGAEAGAVKVLAKSSGECSGGTDDGSTIASYKVKLSGTTAANTCAGFDGTASSDMTAKLIWKVAKGSPKLNPSIATFSLQPDGLALNGNQTFVLSGGITEGSFAGTEVTIHIESQEAAATLLAECSGKGIKKVLFGMDDQTSSCLNGPGLAAAITKQITSIDSNDVPHLEVELLTVTASPFQLTETGITTSATGTLLESLSTSCSLLNGEYRCRHTAFYVSTGACQWDGDYDLSLAYACDPTNTCDLCTGDETVEFSLDSENFCNAATVFCTADLSCAQAIASASTGGVPCCSSTYSPLISCLEANCPTDCATVIAGEGGIVLPDSPCYDCAFANCQAPYFACSADAEICVAE